MPARTLAEFLAYARAHPGRVDYASSGPGTPYHIAAEVFRARAGIDINHIPFRGSNEARTAIIAGQVQMMFDAIPTMAEQARAGRVRALGTSGPRRSPLLPDVPAIAEELPGYEASIWLGLMAPAGTPPAVIERLNAEVNRIMSLPATQEAQLRMGALTDPMSVAAFAEFLRQDIARQGGGDPPCPHPAELDAPCCSLPWPAPPPTARARCWMGGWGWRAATSPSCPASPRTSSAAPCAMPPSR